MTRSRHTWTLLALGAMASTPTWAGYAFDAGDLSGEFTLGAGAANIAARNVNFGLGRIDLRDGRNTGEKADWQEAYVKPGLTLGYALDPDTRLLAGGSVLAPGTWGDGDAGGYTRGNDGRTGVEEAWAGVQHGEWKLSGGRQNFMVGTGFIVMDGDLDMHDDGAYWLGPRTAFRDSAILAFGHDEVSAQAFSLRTDDHLGDFRMDGVNLDYAAGGAVSLGAMAMRVNSLDRQANQLQPRDGMQVYNLRALQGKVPGIDDLTLHGEYAIERGNGSGIDYDASAWYAQADYALPALPLQPLLSYRHARFSGDDDPSDNTQKNWDPLSKGFIDWSTWLLGDIVGNYMLYNSNERVDQWTLRTHVAPTLSLGGIHYRFSLDEKVFNGIPVSDRRFANENVVFLDWTPTPAIYTSLSCNWAQPLGAARELFGNDDFRTLEMYVTYRY
ncbi:hypothetical protein LNN38_16745 [Pseudomonas sp. LA21]|uniref:hypothetical protein n=1 Tax=unclassified Pseudomonas TaxID=196821 RepID=UPI001FB6DD1A|nr:hypothetical protein [Pseudomonas sp. LA21]MCJ1886507.1 hypothetical protein [Pseudomonas sp. LA21]